ncbi:MAG TPA: antibiotic biosynthesis monooxygenase, partial [Corynebacterium nuruki]|nr:antibiotic biosynthesis monooxygenase [Corynebacterium nuruki]
MILINVRFRPLPEYLENFREVVTDFTDAARAEDGCLFFQWYRNTDDPEEYLLIEAYKDGTDVAHVQSDHFKAACEM